MAGGTNVTQMPAVSFRENRDLGRKQPITAQRISGEERLQPNRISEANEHRPLNFILHQLHS